MIINGTLPQETSCGQLPCWCSVGVLTTSRDPVRKKKLLLWKLIIDTAHRTPGLFQLTPGSWENQLCTALATSPQTLLRDVSPLSVTTAEYSNKLEIQEPLLR
jgi:hypothetical protein